MFLKKNLFVLCLSVISVLSMAKLCATEAPSGAVFFQQQRRNSCAHCMSIAQTSQVIAMSFCARDKNEFFILMQSQLGEALRNPCRCILLERVKIVLRQTLRNNWHNVSPNMIQELRESGQLFYDRGH